ncbi:YraN family protein [Sphingobacterium sp. SRCM116780]|uniref:YraN family protein n=1 Tax=Sphingobacterium sp. SRCM116780 TaxID=2907623 RepID=UPI001F1AE89E|nr:YraN family protein [Sphingobacterium sp. SRCM116780]UIR55568.1 YraN family protein [Sphingobacterium sp. SRCM116780]
MAKHLEFGKLGELYADKFLQDLGCEIVLRNWRYKNLEVDLIVKDADILVFVEVKTRSQLDFGEPFEFVDWQKKRKLTRAADCYLRKYKITGEIRFDIVSILIMEKENVQIEHIKDAFWNE